MMDGEDGVTRAIQVSGRYDQNCVIGTPPNANGAPTTLRLRNQNTWGTFASWLSDHKEARNLYYFGHFDKKELGGTTDPQLSIGQDDLRYWLGNLGDQINPGPATHPFRFVFIDGCNSATTDLPTVFGIPKREMSDQEFANRHAYPRAFVGWNTVKLFGINHGVMNQEHKQFVEDFFRTWSTETKPNGTHYGLKEAIDKALKGKTLIPPVIYGATNLQFHPYK